MSEGSRDGLQWRDNSYANGRSWVDVAWDVFVFIGLVTGLTERRFTNMRMALSAHLEGVMNGTFLIVLGAIWGHVDLPPRVAKAARWSANTWVNSLASLTCKVRTIWPFRRTGSWTSWQSTSWSTTINSSSKNSAGVRVRVTVSVVVFMSVIPSCVRLGYPTDTLIVTRHVTGSKDAISIGVTSYGSIFGGLSGVGSGGPRGVFALSPGVRSCHRWTPGTRPARRKPNCERMNATT